MQKHSLSERSRSNSGVVARENARPLAVVVGGRGGAEENERVGTKEAIEK